MSGPPGGSARIAWPPTAGGIRDQWHVQSPNRSAPRSTGSSSATAPAVATPLMPWRTTRDRGPVGWG